MVNWVLVMGFYISQSSLSLVNRIKISGFIAVNPVTVGLSWDNLFSILERQIYTLGQLGHSNEPFVVQLSPNLTLLRVNWVAFVCV